MENEPKPSLSCRFRMPEFSGVLMHLAAQMPCVLTGMETRRNPDGTWDYTLKAESLPEHDGDFPHDYRPVE